MGPDDNTQVADWHEKSGGELLEKYYTFAIAVVSHDMTRNEMEWNGVDEVEWANE